MSIAGCTIAAKPLWSYARVLARSFRAHHPACPFYVLLADEPQGCVDPDAEPFTCVPLTALALPRLEALRFRYAQQPFTYACTPHLIAWLHAQGVDRVIYFKQESLVTGSLEPLIDRADDIGDCHLLRRTRQPITAAGAANAFHQRMLAQFGEQLLQVGQGNSLALRDFGQGDGTITVVDGQVHHGRDRVATFG